MTPKLSPRIVQKPDDDGAILLSIDGAFAIGKLGKSQHGRWVYYPSSSWHLEATLLQSIANGLMQLNGHVDGGQKEGGR
jgi:hypothetical protein